MPIFGTILSPFARFGERYDCIYSRLNGNPYYKLPGFINGGAIPPIKHSTP